MNQNCALRLLVMIVAALGASGIGQVFDGALLIVIFATSGALEAFATARTADSVRALLDVAPEQATRPDADSGETVVNTVDLQVARPRSMSGCGSSRSWSSKPYVRNGHAEVRGVPGDQLAVLRKEIRSLIRQRTGHPSETLVHGDLLHVVCEPLRDPEAEMRAAAEAFDAVLFGKQRLPSVRRERDRVVSWSAWAQP